MHRAFCGTQYRRPTGTTASCMAATFWVSTRPRDRALVAGLCVCAPPLMTGPTIAMKFTVQMDARAQTIGLRKVLGHARQTAGEARSLAQNASLAAAPRSYPPAPAPAPASGQSTATQLPVRPRRPQRRCPPAAPWQHAIPPPRRLQAGAWLALLPVASPSQSLRHPLRRRCFLLQRPAIVTVYGDAQKRTLLAHLPRWQSVGA